MVELQDGKAEKLPNEFTKEKVVIGNDKRQFIIRIPVKVSKNTILKSYDKKYLADIKVDTTNPYRIIIELRKNAKP